MLNAKYTQFTLGDDGQIRYQENISNPVPGEPVAIISKGSAALKPDIEVFDACLSGGQDKVKTKDFLVSWISEHISLVLEPLAGLDKSDDFAAPVRGICYRLYEAMGIVPRAELEDLISGLDQEMRQALRAKKIRLGPILAFIPELNKPAAMRLRGLLWALNNEKSLPAGVPNDGIVSLKIDPAEVDIKFYQSIGYPVYGPRAVRIDMLDRVINSVYDSAQNGKFQAQHEMAEWLGCSIEDLYAILASMGHSKFHDPADEDKIEKIEKAKEKIKEEGVKPELATFRLKKGRASQQDKFQNNNKQQKKPGKRNKSTNRTIKIMQAGPKPRVEDSPFAVLEQLLKAGKDEA